MIRIAMRATCLLSLVMLAGCGEDPSVQKASVSGKYTHLLKTIEVPEDADKYSEFNDYGYHSKTEYMQFKNLPVGYWVYVYPNWYIWGEQNGVTTPPATTAPASTAQAPAITTPAQPPAEASVPVTTETPK